MYLDSVNREFVINGLDLGEKANEIRRNIFN